jgi:hypothetical protein
MKAAVEEFEEWIVSHDHQTFIYEEYAKKVYINNLNSLQELKNLQWEIFLCLSKQQLCQVPT